jgi:hypothetical protein
LKADGTCVNGERNIKIVMSFFEVTKIHSLQPLRMFGSLPPLSTIFHGSQFGIKYYIKPYISNFMIESA